MATIRFRLSADALERISFTYGPMLEAVFSLHVLVEPQRHPLHHPWVRRMRGLPASLRREMAACAFVLGAAPPGLGTTLPNPLARLPTEPSESFADALERLGALPADAVAAELADALATAARHRPADDAALRMASEEPREFLDRVARLLGDYWDSAFEREWQRLEPHLADSVAHAGRVLLAGGLPGFVDSLGPRVRARVDGPGFDLDVSCAPQWGSAAAQQDLEVDVTGGFAFVPSAFSWPHIWYSVDHPWPLGMSYHAPFVERQARAPMPPVDLVRVLRACGDEVRLRALRRIADRPRSTQELAPLVGVTESTLSKHLRQLTEAGLLRTRRDGYYVLYELDRTLLGSLSDDLLAFLGGEPGSTADRQPDSSSAARVSASSSAATAGGSGGSP